MKKRSAPTQEVAVVVDDALLLEITNLHDEVVQGVRQTIAKCIRIGELLAKKKSELAHGKWGPWLKAHAPFSSTTAWRYMRCFEKRGDLNLSSTKDLQRSIEHFAQISVEQEPPALYYDDEAVSMDLLRPEQSEFQLETQSTTMSPQPTNKWQTSTIAGQLIALLERVFQDSAQRAQAWESIKRKLDKSFQQPPKSDSLIAGSWLDELYDAEDNLTLTSQRVSGASTTPRSRRVSRSSAGR